ncbi:YbaB/EbfC family nucleoid-associated protein [Nonomuraea sp. KC401]|uniref:YbaB/EbfC family nucleoid-associated protein n=1 Tax=unclassified Nonomuraea TaxID=2593643 RepID=UPI0010FF60B9|nr:MULTISPECIES: YbaB/EbfC family nucleoid-associated protein [unclassified Nonomuraea]NBE95313.1 hypothetical protein [Nonomuraea sp. K271]TLF72408.1 YbaB/EbfC family nucleoid-associated protein [Nonomuraea sp. KC401]
MRPSAELQELYDRLAAQAEQTAATLRSARTRLATIRGTGSEELAEATSDAHLRIVGLTLNPRAMRLGPQELARQIVQAVQAAQRDAERQAAQVMEEVEARTASTSPPLDAGFVRERIDQLIGELDR